MFKIKEYLFNFNINKKEIKKIMLLTCIYKYMDTQFHLTVAEFNRALHVLYNYK